MNIEFHYYLTKYLALEAGFEEDEAEIIAYSSQYVDDNCYSYVIKCPDGTEYNNYISQTYNILKPYNSLMRIYMLFHFIPGDPLSQRVRRKDGKMHSLITTPGSRNAENILFEAIKIENLYLIGIASHAYSDTYSHQNFVGLNDEINGFRGLPEKLIPNIGHADAGFKPDIPNLIWKDVRLISIHQEINNAERVIAAAKNLYSNYLMLTSFGNKWNIIKEKLEALLATPVYESDKDFFENQSEERTNAIKKMIKKLDPDSDNNYDKNRWFKQVINEEIRFLDDKEYSFDPIRDKYTFKENYEKKHWYKFQEAVKKYQKISESKLKPVMEYMELYNW